MNETELKDKIASALEAYGFSRAVAGDADFDSVIRATAQVIGREKVGIYFAGAVGVGKTAAARAAASTVAELAGRTQFTDRFCAFSVEDMKRLAEVAESRDVADCIIDDIATDNALREYGNTTDPFAKFVMAWDARIDAGLPTALLYVTTNENADGVQRRYGARVFDRIVWRLAPCQLSGSTKRGSIGSPWRTKAKPTDSELYEAAQNALMHTDLRGDEFFDAARQKVEDWKREADERAEFFRLASRLARQMSANR